MNRFRLPAWVLVLSVVAGCAAPAAIPGGAPFALLGDVPYSQAEANYLDGMINEMNRAPLAFVVHLGDITSGDGPCSDPWLEERKKQFARWRAPLVVLPGDNEWTDCHRTGFDPMERLQKWRSLFCDAVPAVPAVPAFRAERQPGEYCEHLRWRHEGILFVALNVPGSNNNLGRTPAMDREYEHRMLAVQAWIDTSIALAKEENARAVVLLMQANPMFQRGAGDRPRDGYSALRRRLAAHALDLKDRLVIVHGDTHVFRDDRPLPGLRRIEVHGSPFLRWLRVFRSDLAQGKESLVVENGR